MKNDLPPFNVPLVWFRDHCRSAASYNHATNQRKSNMVNITEKAKIADKAAVLFNTTNKELSIYWNDGHTSTFPEELLLEMIIRPDQKSPHVLYYLWNGNANHLPILNKSSFSFAEFSQKFVDYGFVAIEGLDKTAEATEKFARALAPLHDTYFGAFWVFNNNANQQDNYHEDTAYSNEEIGPHTDGTYFPQTPGIQVFHCLQPAEKGGETLLVDGFAAAERLKQENPSAYDILVSTPIDHHYIEQGDNPLFSWSPARPVIEKRADGGYEQIRFNPYDRAPLRLSKQMLLKPELIVDFYDAYQAFSRICHDPAMVIKIQLTPGTVIFIDNLRVLHARTAFSGFRQMCGCYLSKDNLMAKSRVHISSEDRLHV